MWNRKREDPPLPRPSSMTPTATDLAREGIPMSTTPTRLSEPGDGAAAIGKSVVVKGQIYSREDLYVDGEIDGTVEVQEHRLTVGPNGKVTASVEAREVIVRGTVHGDIHAGEKIDIRKEAKLVGDLKTSRIVIEEGAYFKGSVDILRTDVNRTEAAPKPTASSAAGPAGNQARPSARPPAKT